MKTKIRTIQCKPYRKEDFDGALKRSKRTVVIPVDFQKIENAPRTDLEIEIQKKIAAAPSASDLLIAEEEKTALKKMLDSNLLSNAEMVCVNLSLEGLRPIEIARKLKVRDTTVHNHLSRAIAKLKAALKEGSYD